MKTRAMREKIARSKQRVMKKLKALNAAMRRHDKLCKGVHRYGFTVRCETQRDYDAAAALMLLAEEQATVGSIEAREIF